MHRRLLRGHDCDASSVQTFVHLLYTARLVPSTTPLLLASLASALSTVSLIMLEAAPALLATSMTRTMQEALIASREDKTIDQPHLHK